MGPSATPISDFYEKHGTYIVSDDGWAYFENGAMAHASSNHPELIEPPEDAWKRQKLIVHYWGLRFQAVAAEYENQYAELAACVRFANKNGTHPPGESDYLFKLVAKLKDEVHAIDAKLKAAKRKCERLIPQSVKDAEREAARAEQRRQAALNRAMDRVEALRL